MDLVAGADPKPGGVPIYLYNAPNQFLDFQGREPRAYHPHEAHTSSIPAKTNS